MAIEFVCPACQGALRVADDAAGRVVRCGSCMATLRVPVPPAGESEPPAPEPPPPTRRTAATPVRPPDEDRPRDDDDRYDDAPRPRRRRRRGPPPKAGRSPLFWVVVILLVIGFLVVATCGGTFLLLAQPRWRAHDSAQGGFRVDLPADPQPDIGHMAGAPPRPGVTVEGAILVGRMEVYTVTHTDVQEAGQVRPPAAALLAAAKKGLLEELPDARVVREGPVAVANNHPAEEVVLTRDDECFICRIIIAGPKVYVLGVGGPWLSPNGNDRTRRFFDSFAVTNPPAGRPANAGRGGNPWRGRNNPPPVALPPGEDDE